MLTDLELKCARQIIKDAEKAHNKDSQIAYELRNEFDEKISIILWQLHKENTLDLAKHPELWLSATRYEDAGYTAQDAIEVLLKTSQDQAILEECRSQRSNLFFADCFLRNLDDADLPPFVDCLPHLNEAIAQEIKYALATKGLQKAEDLAPETLSNKAASVLKDYYDHKVRAMFAIWPEADVANAINTLASQPGYHVDEIDFLEFTADYITAEQMAHVAFNVRKRRIEEDLFEYMDTFSDDLVMHIRDIYGTREKNKRAPGVTAIGWLIQHDLKNNNPVDNDIAKYFIDYVSPRYLERYPEVLASLPRDLAEGFVLDNLYHDEIIRHFCTEKIAETMIDKVVNYGRGEHHFDQGAMENIGAQFPQLVITALENKKNPQRELLVQALAASNDPRAIPTHIEYLGDSIITVQIAARKGLQKQGTAAIDALLEALDSRKKNVRQMASQVLSQLPEAERSAAHIVDKAVAKLKKEKVDSIISYLTIIAGDAAKAISEEKPTSKAKKTKKTTTKAAEIAIIDCTDAEFKTLSSSLSSFQAKHRQYWKETHDEHDMRAFEELAETMQQQFGDRAVIVLAQSLLEKSFVCGFHFKIITAVIQRAEKNAVNAQVLLADWCQGCKEALSRSNSPERVDYLNQLFTRQFELYAQLYGTDFITVVETALTLGRLPSLDLVWTNYLALNNNEQLSASCDRAKTLSAFGDFASVESLKLALTQMPESTEKQLIELLNAKKAGPRANAALVLIEHPEIDSLAALEIAFNKEKNAKTQVALANAVFAAASLKADLNAQIAPKSPLSATQQAEIDALLTRYAGALPKQITLADLPRLVWSSGEPLSDGAMQWVVARLAQQSGQYQDGVLPLLAAQWQQTEFLPLLTTLQTIYGNDKVARIGWVLFAAEIFGNDEIFNEFGRHLDDEARGGASAAAFYKVGMMARIGSNVTLTWLDHWTRKAKSQGLKQRALDALDDAAALRNISRDEIVDLLAADLGFDEKCQQDFAFGERTLTLTLNGDGTMTLSLDGKTLKSAPSTRKDDDEAELKARRAELANFRKQIKQTFSNAKDRLEQAMVTGRTFSQKIFAQTWGSNALLTYLARRVVWCLTINEEAVYVRLDETNQFVDIDDEPVTWPEGALLSVLHPLNSGETMCAEWQEIFTDYEIEMPFPQLARPVFTVPEDESQLRSVKRYNKTEFPTSRLRTQMERRGWANGEPQDGGSVNWLYKYFANADVTVAIHMSNGFCMGFADYDESQEITHIDFMAGRLGRGYYYDQKNLLLSEVNNIVYSETMADLESVLQG